MRAFPKGTKDETGGQHYHLSHPMLFLTTQAAPGDPTTRVDLHYEEAVDVFVVEVKGVIPRVVIHMCRLLEGSDDMITAGYASRIVEGISNAHMALMLQGYRVD